MNNKEVDYFTTWTKPHCSRLDNITNIIVDDIFNKYNPKEQDISMIKDEIKALLHSLQNSAYADGISHSNIQKKPVYL